jgi:hypothetical protein
MENAGCGSSGGVAACAVAAGGGWAGDEAGAAAWDDPDAGAAPAVAAGAAGGVEGGGSRSALCTGRRGAGDGAGGGAVTAGIDAFAVGAPEFEPPTAGPPAAAAPAEVWEAVPGVAAAEAGAGGGAVPTPNNDGDALGDDGSANGAACAACWALVRSATREAVSFFIASASAGGGLGGTVDKFGYAASAPGGGGRCSAILPPSWRCHQFTGLIEDVEHPVRRQARAARTTAGRSPGPRSRYSDADAA